MIEVDGNQWTGVANIYAVGDVAGRSVSLPVEPWSRRGGEATGDCGVKMGAIRGFLTT